MLSLGNGMLTVLLGTKIPHSTGTETVVMYVIHKYNYCKCNLVSNFTTTPTSVVPTANKSRRLIYFLISS